MAGIHNFLIDAGADWERTVTWQDTLAGDSSTRLCLKRNHRQTEPDLVLSTDNGRIGVLETGGSTRYTLTVARDYTALLTGDYIYDFEVTTAGGTTRRLLQGYVHVSPEVSA